VVALGRAARGEHHDTVVRATGVLTTLGIVVAAAFAFSGPLAWWGYSNIGTPTSTGPQRPFDSPLLWLGVAVVVAVLGLPVALLRRARDGGAPRVGTRLAALTPAVVALLAAATSVGVLVSSVVRDGAPVVIPMTSARDGDATTQLHDPVDAADLAAGIALPEHVTRAAMDTP